MITKQTIRILFVGNSHTYTNFLPEIVRDFFAQEGIDTYFDYQTHGGKGLDHHYNNDSVEQFIKKGNYDYIVLQGKATGISPELHIEYGKKIYDEFISQTSSKTIVYEVWPKTARPDMWDVIEKANVDLAKAIDASIAPAGAAWKKALELSQVPDLYTTDGVHASPAGSYLAAACIFYAISKSEAVLEVKETEEPHTRLAVDTEWARKFQKIAFEVTQKYNK